MIDQTWYQKPKNARERLAAGGVVVRVDGKDVLAAFVHEGAFRDFVLPKGGVEKGETDEEAARREIEEEAGFSRLTLLADLGTCERLNYSKTRWVKTHYFLFLTAETNAKPTDRRHKHAAEWWPLDNLPAMFWPEQRELIEKNREQIVRAARGRAV